jgi:hypothetical protein
MDGNYFFECVKAGDRGVTLLEEVSFFGLAIVSENSAPTCSQPLEELWSLILEWRPHRSRISKLPFNRFCQLVRSHISHKSNVWEQDLGDRTSPCF